jgi:hypothetical protein
MPSYLFVLCPPYYGSTLLSKLRNPLQACQRLAAFMWELGDMDYMPPALKSISSMASSIAPLPT